MAAVNRDNPAGIMLRMADIERQIAELEPDWSQAENTFVRANERKKLREAQLRFTYRGQGTVQDVDAMVRNALWTDEEGYMQRREDADAALRARKARFEVLKAELMSLQTRLNALVSAGERP
jgi:hypothetical protein